MPFDVPNEVPPPAEQRKADSGQHRDKLVEELFPMDLVSGRSAGKIPGSLQDHGQIQRMSIPAGWQEGPSSINGAGTSHFREFHPREDPQVKLCFYYRGLRTSREAAKNFRDVLDKPPHVLSSAELASLKETLRDRGNPRDFKVLTAQTEDINGKRVLVVEGTYTGIQQDARAILVDSDGTGSAVQEIYFQAPKGDYLRYLKTAKDSMKSIRWK
ncbi:MAG TPA: hypothetical protein V6D08_07440 [Candidatus Obscuribacterales bacterium]